MNNGGFTIAPVPLANAVLQSVFGDHFGIGYLVHILFGVVIAAVAGWRAAR